jgi:UDP-GlcNAc3NAcA epimerase
MLKVVTILGARPQFIKAAVVSRAMIEHGDGIQEVIVHTGQHFDKNMSGVFFEEMEIPEPQHWLGINRMPNGMMTELMMNAAEKILKMEKPDLVLVYGDTNSTLAGALSAKKLNIRLVHVEAGLRSFNNLMPEEINRILTDRISDQLFCPTENAIKQLQKEELNQRGKKIVNTGDVMYDAALYYSAKAEIKSMIIKNLGLHEFILCTLHRAENTDNITRLKSIVEALNRVNKKTKLIVPLHPRTGKAIEDSGIPVEFKIIEPVGYFDMIQLVKNCRLVMTDSGGLQKEAYFFKKHCLVLRNETEWTELVDGGYNILTGSDPEKIVNAMNNLSGMKADFSEKYFGDGNAGRKIVQQILA